MSHSSDPSKGITVGSILHEMEKGHLSDLFKLRRKLLPATLTPSLDDKTATLRLHALTKTVGLLAPMVVRLISPLHFLNTSLLA